MMPTQRSKQMCKKKKKKKSSHIFMGDHNMQTSYTEYWGRGRLHETCYTGKMIGGEQSYSPLSTKNM